MLNNFHEWLLESRGDTSAYEPPKYLVKPAEGDKGFFMVKAQFDALKGGKRDSKSKKKFSPKIEWKFADEGKM